jgi:hypothetical protein
MAGLNFRSGCHCRARVACSFQYPTASPAIGRTKRSGFLDLVTDHRHVEHIGLKLHERAPTTGSRLKTQQMHCRLLLQTKRASRNGEDIAIGSSR